MSFVLDAQRRKAESANPDQAARAAYQTAQTQKQRKAWALAFTALLLVLFAAAWFSLRPQLDATPTTTASSESTPTLGTAPQVNPSVAIQIEQPRRSTPPPALVAREVEKPVARPLRTLGQATPDSQNELLSFNYSSHIYGSHPDTRTVIVDGNKLVQGDMHNGWRLTNINETGVVWDNGMERVVVPVLEMWDN